MDNRNDNYEPNFILKDSEPVTDQTDRNKATAEGSSSASAEQRQEASCWASWSCGRSRPADRGFSDEEHVSDSFRPEKPKKRLKRSGGSGSGSGVINITKKGLALLICVCMLLSCLCGVGSALVVHKIQNSSTIPEVQQSVSKDGYNLHDPTGANMSVAEINQATKDSVVEITTESASSASWLPSYVTKGAGSGVVITRDGYIMTNNHVISGAQKITVTTTNEKSYDATIVGADATTDVAVLKIDASDLHPVTYGNSDNLEVGDLAVAIGNPLGELGGTVTAGIISAKDRTMVLEGKTMHLLQTDSSINPGNSGGGLFNEDGQLIGLVVAKSSGSDVEGLGFAIPINVAADVAQQLMSKGFVSGQPWTGMTYTEGSSGFDSWFGSESGTVYIYSVDTDIARKEGFKPGDIVYSVEDQPITSIDDLSAIVTAHKVGDRLSCIILRDGEKLKAEMLLQEKTEE